MAYCYAELAVSSLAMAVIITSTHFAYPRRDGQAELAWVSSDGRSYNAADAEEWKLRYGRACHHDRQTASRFYWFWLVSRALNWGLAPAGCVLCEQLAKGC